MRYAVLPRSPWTPKVVPVLRIVVEPACPAWTLSVQVVEQPELAVILGSYVAPPVTVTD